MELHFDDFQVGKNYWVEVRSVMGAIVEEAFVNNDHIELNTKSLATGTYFLRVREGSEIRFIRFVKK
jgi:hypothetical protein